MNTAAPVTPQKPKLPWSVVHTITDGVYAIEISRLPLRLPKYSAKLVCQQSSNGLHSPFIPFYFEAKQAGQISFKGKYPSDAIHALFQQAEEWVLNTAANAIQDEMIEREMKDAERGKQVTRHTGKTERKRAAGK